MEKVQVSKDKDKLDPVFIQSFLTRSYWAKGRSLEQVKTTIQNSLCYGLYRGEKQIGFARVLSDFVAFAYLMDVFVVEEERGQGFGSTLMTTILNDPELAAVQRWMLGTRDAHSLYRKFGFSEIPRPEWLMGLVKTT